MASNHFNDIFKNYKGHKDVPDIQRDTQYYQKDSSCEFPIKNYIIEHYGQIPCALHLDELFSDKVLDFLLENGTLLSFSSNGKAKHLCKNLKGFRGGNFWFKYKDDTFVRLIVQNQDGGDLVSYGIDPTEEKYENNNNKFFKVSLVSPCNTQLPIDDFLPFISEKKGSKIHLFIKNSFGEYSFEPLDVKIPKNMDIELNYGKKFVPVCEIIKQRLIEKNSGLYMFHGPPGTGKSSFIKYLAGEIKKDFIYIPTTMLETFTTDPSCLQMLIEKNNSILVLEDAEKLIMKRYGDNQDSSSVSALLNLSDGILSDILNISVLITYNCQTDKVDDALLRKGRLQTDYKFDLLSVEDSKTLCKHLKMKKKVIDEIKSPMSLADIYNMENENTFYERTKDDPSQKRIGF